MVTAVASIPHLYPLQLEVSQKPQDDGDEALPSKPEADIPAVPALYSVAVSSPGSSEALSNEIDCSIFDLVLELGSDVTNTVKSCIQYQSVY